MDSWLQNFIVFSTCRPLQVDGHFWCGIRKPVDLHSLTAIFGPAVIFLPNISQPVDLYSLTTIFGYSKKCQKPWRRLQVDGQLASNFYCFSQPVDLCRLTDNFKQQRATNYLACTWPQQIDQQVFLACLRHTSGISKVYLRHISVISQKYLRYISGIIYVYLKHTSCIYHSYILHLMHISCISHVNLMYIS